MKTAYFSLGCFWSPQLEFEKIKGVKKAEVGYCGGNDPNTTYEKVCSGSTNHAETIKVEFDENEISYEQLVRFFFKFYDPTQLNRQGPDICTQKRIAEKIKEEFNKKFNGKVVTNISEEKLYQPAEEYHQYYLKRKGIL